MLSFSLCQGDTAGKTISTVITREGERQDWGGAERSLWGAERVLTLTEARVTQAHAGIKTQQIYTLKWTLYCI